MKAKPSFTLIQRAALLLALKPVTFRYKSDVDPDGIPQFGLIAEEVEKVDPDLVVRDEKNQVFSVRYEAVNAMLLNEFLKQHRKVEQQHTEIETLKQRLDALEKIIRDHSLEASLAHQKSN